MKKKLLFIALIVFASGIHVVNAYKIQFSRAEGPDYANYGTWEPIIVKTCWTNSSGKLDSSCLNMIYKVCHAWNENRCWTERGTSSSGYSNNGYYPVCNNQTPESAISIDDLGNIAFTGNKTYYCHTGSSQHPASDNVGCYVCNSNHNIMKWDTDNAADSNCSSYTYNGNYDENDCYQACYVCKDNAGIVKWDINGDKDNNCSAGYNKDTTKNESQCKPSATPTPTPTPSPTPTPTPSATPTSACYVCNSDKNIMYWRANGTGDIKCPAGYTKDTTKNESQCNPVEPPKEACYVCKADKQVYRWKTTSEGDEYCRGGYDKTTLSKDNCLANPKTGSVKAIVALLIELAAFAVIFSYVSDTIFKKKKSK